MPALLRFVALIATPIALLIFLITGDFFASWDGQVASFKPSRVEDPAVFQVLIVEEDGTAVEKAWPAPLVRELDVTPNALAIVPKSIPEDAPTTAKLGFSFNYKVTIPAKAEGEKDKSSLHTTISQYSVGVSVIALLLMVALRNMIVAGSPFALERAPETTGGGSSSTSGGSGSQGRPQRTRGRKGPPPSRRRKGQGRRR